MRSNQLIILSACSVMILSSCSKLKPLTASDFTVDPQPLETVAGKVPTTINGVFPEKFMKKKMTVTLTPELRYGNGQVAQGTAAKFQGEKVLGNDQTVSYKNGGNYTMKSNFTYVPDMHKSELWMNVDARKGSKNYNLPAVKIGNGVLSTSELYRRTLTNDGGCLAVDSFQRITAHKQEARVKFLINQANLRKSELKNNSVKEFVEMLRKINADTTGLDIQNVEVSAYASPDGGFKFNDKLANKRQNVSEDYVRRQLKATKVDADIDAHYTAQDWEGFQELVQASNIQDKDVILRVLSMYKDPEEREQQIRNMSEGFRDLATGILPELRRSRLIINYNVVGRSDDEIRQQLKDDASKLSLEELLYAASLEQSASGKKDIYEKAAKLYPNDYRAYNNLAALAFNAGDESSAKNYANKALQVSSNAPEAKANLGLLALKNGDVATAEKYIGQATEANNYNQVSGNLNLAKGLYAQAEKDFGSVDNNSAALAQLLNKDYSACSASLRAVKNRDAMTDYLTAIVNCRLGNTYAAKEALKSALAKDPSLKEYADSDYELEKLNK